MALRLCKINKNTNFFNHGHAISVINKPYSLKKSSFEDEAGAALHSSKQSSSWYKF